MKEEGKMASSDDDSDDGDELLKEERELQKQFDALLDILEEPGIPPVSKEDVDVIKSEIFGMQTFFVTSVETIGGDLDDMESGPAITPQRRLPAVEDEIRPWVKVEPVRCSGVT